MSNQEIQQRGELIAVCSGNGGIGRTLLAVNLAIALKKKNLQVSILDADFQFGDVNMALDLQSKLTILNLVNEINRLDETGLNDFLVTHGSGVTVLSAPARPEYANLITTEVIEKAVDLLVKENDYVVVDTEVGLQEKSLTIIEKADQILLITNLEIATLKNTKLMLETFVTLGLRDKVKIIVNQSTTKGIIKLADLPAILGKEALYCIPSNVNVATKSLNQGIPIVTSRGTSDLAKAYYKLAEQLIDKKETTGIIEKRPSLLSGVFSKQKQVKRIERK